jgi:hypothetical protein
MQPVRGVDRFAKAKQAFDDLGSALQSGDLTTAKQALAERQKNAPQKANKGSNPLADKIDALGKAIDSGDVAGARQAYADIKSALAQRAPRAGGPPVGGPLPGGAPPRGGHGGGSHGTGESSSSSSNPVYDPKDANKDGKVSLQEELAYDLSHAQATTQSATKPTAQGTNNSIDTVA